MKAIKRITEPRQDVPMVPFTTEGNHVVLKSMDPHPLQLRRRSPMKQYAAVAAIGALMKQTHRHQHVRLQQSTKEPKQTRACQLREILLLEETQEML